MKTNYFKECKSKDDAKRLYKKLAFKHHPDKGGDVETMKEINNQFDDFMTNFREEKKIVKKNMNLRQLHTENL